MIFSKKYLFLIFSFVLLLNFSSVIFAQRYRSFHDQLRVTENIEKYRKSDAQLTIVNRDNRPLDGIIVKIEQIENDFLFGITPEYLIFPESNGIFARERWGEVLPAESVEIMKEKILNLGLNMLNFNYFYWNDYEPRQGYYPIEESAMRLVDWAFSKDFILKGHNLAWSNNTDGSADWFPELIKSNPAAARKALENQIRRVVRTFKGKIKYWDVVNEPIIHTHGLSDPDRIFEKIDPDYILHAFQWVREEDPNALLTFNETRVIGHEGQPEAFLECIKDFLKKSAPIDIIGLQGHFR